MTLPATFTLAQAMDDAFERIGKEPKDIALRHIQSARRSIRLMLTDWNADSVLFWKVVSGTHTVALDESSFALPAGSIDALDVAVRRDGIDITLMVTSRSDWFQIPDKDSAVGRANQYWVDRSVDPPVLNFYPKADNATDIIVYDVMSRFNESSALASAPDVPELWNHAFVSGLTAYLAEKYAPERFVEKMALYGGPGNMKGAYARAKMGNRERAPLVMVRG